MISLRGLPAIALALSAACVAAPARQDPGPGARVPNVVVILADDAGYADFGFQGGTEVRTPNIDALAANGVSYRNAYVTMPFCSPSRAGLLTGRYPQRFGYEFNLTQSAPPGVDPEFMGLAVEELTLGDLMRAEGYTTIAVGKWHLGSAPQFHPNRRGFDQFYGFLGGASRYHPGLEAGEGGMMRNGDAARPASYLTDDLAEAAAAYIGQYRDRPFVLYLAFNAVHTPMDTLAADLRQVAPAGNEQRRRLLAMTLALDRAVGKVIAALRDNGLLDDTLVVFTNDNGGDRIGIGADNAPLRGTKGTLLEGGVRVPLVLQWPGVIAPGTTFGGIVSLMDIVPTAVTVAGGRVPDNLDGRTLLTPAGELAGGHEALFWRYDVAAAVRDGEWKLIRYPDRPPELYDVVADAGESTDLAARYPARVRDLMQELFRWEAGLSHPRWHTGTYWSQEDVRRYSSEYVDAEQARTAQNPSGEVH